MTQVATAFRQVIVRSILASAILLVWAFRIHADEIPAFDDLAVRARDIHWCFDSIRQSDGKLRFELSRNVMGMLWRTIDGVNDLTGVCNYKQTLILTPAASLEIKGRRFVLLLKPIANPFGTDQVTFNVWKRVGQSSRGEDTAFCSTVLAIGKEGQFIVVSGEE